MIEGLSLQLSSSTTALFLLGPGVVTYLFCLQFQRLIHFYLMFNVDVLFCFAHGGIIRMETA